MLTKRHTIKASHPVRNKVAELSSGRYYETKRAFYNSLADTLEWFGLRLGDYITMAWDDGSATWLLYEGETELDTMVKVSWYRLGSGRYEITVYLT
jgi:hypothetical protein